MTYRGISESDIPKWHFQTITLTHEKEDSMGGDEHVSILNLDVLLVVFKGDLIGGAARVNLLLWIEPGFTCGAVHGSDIAEAEEFLGLSGLLH